MPNSLAVDSDARLDGWRVGAVATLGAGALMWAGLAWPAAAHVDGGASVVTALVFVGAAVLLGGLAAATARRRGIAIWGGIASGLIAVLSVTDQMGAWDAVSLVVAAAGCVTCAVVAWREQARAR
ncbi:hypothetical protein [Demequina pelophila]|uniref:hypothetical protein n=1 Tax=Demequina pelophila TaxID=1638984 RepID=UPI0012E05D0C|nr:hypothetical protein [Demequina pelophila]